MRNETKILYGKRKDLGVETAPIGTTELCETLKGLLLEILSADILIPVDLAYRISKAVGLVKEAQDA